MDLEIPGALPTMVCRAPTINGSPRAIRNLDAVKSMPGITDVAIIEHTAFVPGGVAVRGQTFGQGIDAIRALDVGWGPGTVDGKSDADVQADLKQAELPLTPAPPLAKTLEQVFTFSFRPVSDAAFEAAVISQTLRKPVKLMWHRTDNFRQGRVHPMCTSRVRLTYATGNVLAFDQRHTSVATDFTMGFGEILSATLATLPAANSLGYSQAVFNLTQSVPYNFGLVTQLLNEIYDYNTFNTGSVRNIYSPNVTKAAELMVDQLAQAMRRDPYELRHAFVRDSRMQAVLDKVARVGNWGRSMRPGTTQGIAIHGEYTSRGACLVEIDCTPGTVTRQIQDGYAGPRVTKVVFAG